jgi:hypothetical protein
MGYLPRAGRAANSAGARSRPEPASGNAAASVVSAGAAVGNCALGEDVTSGQRLASQPRPFSIWHGALLHPTRAHDRAVPLRLVIAYPYRAIPYPGERL